jgi:hypothetical protein
LHEDPAHAKGRPIGFEKTWLGGVIAGETRGTGDAVLVRGPEGMEWRGPLSRRDWAAVVLMLKEA